MIEALVSAILEQKVTGQVAFGSYRSLVRRYGAPAPGEGTVQGLWVPRDAWCEPVDDRINAAFKRGGHDALLGGLRSLGLRVDHSLCLPRSAVECALADATVTVRVREPMRFWYPLSPMTDCEDGRKPVDFDPPREVLQGERIHQWLGSRHGRDPAVRALGFDAGCTVLADAHHDDADPLVPLVGGVPSSVLG